MGMVDPQGRRTPSPRVLVPRPHRKLTWLLGAPLSVLSAGAWACLTVLGSGEVIDYRLLGPLEVAVNGHAVDVGGLKQRALLAILLLHANQPVYRDVLIDQLWAEHPPAGAEHAVEVYIWRLRKALESASGSQCVLTRPGAYLLQAAEEQVDVARFERLAEAGRRALAAEDPGRAAADLGEALALWRGQLLADFRSEPFAQAEIARLEELRAGVVEDRIEADLALGRHAICRQRAGGARCRAGSARATAPAADDRVVPLRAAGGCPGRLPEGAADAGGGSRDRTGRAVAAAGARDPGRRIPRWTPAAYQA